MKQWKTWGWKNKASFVFAIVLTVVAAGSIAYMVITEDDPTLMAVCWLPGGSAQYVESDMEAPLADPFCTDPEPIMWPSDALTVAIVAATGEPLDGTGDEELVVNAMERVNANLDTRMTLVQTADDADIVVVFRAAFEVGVDDNRIAGSCRHRMEGGRMRAELELRPAGDIRVEYRRAIHEFGHCLGLGHWPVDIMRKGDLADEGRRMDPDRFADGQVDLIESTYP